MAYTVSDVATCYADSLRLVAGEGGLANPVTEVGILDYELLPQVKSRFQRLNFYEGQLVLSTFLYAKDDPYLITEAIKYLVSKGSSGLIFKNVLHLQLPDGAVRYANARNFPLFMAAGDHLMFDEVITTVDRALRRIASADLVQQELDRLMQGHTDPQQVLACARTLNPSLRDEHRVLYVVGGSDVASRDFAQVDERYQASELNAYTNLFARYDDGLLLVVSGERMVGDGGRKAGDMLVRHLCAEVLESEASVAVGLSDTHYELRELGDAMIEAIRAARFAAHEGTKLVRYADLGSYRLLLPHLDSPALQAFSYQTLEPLRIYDAETGSSLRETLAAFCDCGQNFTLTAQTLGQHENTVRRRMERVAAVTGLTYRDANQMEQLSLAHKIERCRQIVS